MREYTKETMDADIVVAGAGLSGFCAAVAAARQGMRTILVNDRSVIGGNSGKEIRVAISGAAHRVWNRFAQETGILEEFLLNIARLARDGGGWSWEKADRVYFEMADAEENLRFVPNTVVHRVNCTPSGIIESMEGLQMRSERHLVFRGRYFIDCTGDGVVGYLAGADFRHGREARSEFGETMAPEAADSFTMGATLTFSSRDMGRPVVYRAPKGAVDIASMPNITPELNRGLYRSANGNYGYVWWAEYGGHLDSVRDDEEVCRHTRMLVYGLWDYIKNSGKFGDVENLELDWIAPVPGKRESRRLMGPVIATEGSLMAQTRYPDAVGYAGYPLDLHPPYGYLDGERSSRLMYLPGIADIPLRTLYSTSVGNLLFAGRCVSASHVGIGTLRLAGTGAVTGQAVGTAASLCVRLGCTPDSLAHGHAEELRECLMSGDQSLVGRVLTASDDPSRTAEASASSVRGSCIPDGDAWVPLKRGMGLILPVADGFLGSVSFKMRGMGGSRIGLSLYGTGKPENYRFSEPLGECSATIDGEGWYEFLCRVDAGDGGKVMMVFDVSGEAEVGIRVSHTEMAGVLGISAWGFGDSGIGPDTAYKCLDAIPCFTTDPSQDLFAASCVIDGYIRPHGLPHMWSSAEMVEGEPEWVALRFGAGTTVGRVELVFNTDLNKDHMYMDNLPPQLVRDYRIEGLTAHGWVTLADERGNHLRFRRHRFPQTDCTAIRLVVTGTWGGRFAEVFDLRVYGE